MPLFAHKGFSGTTTKQVAEAAQVSEGLLFKYFANKTALYAAIVEHCSNDDPTRFQALEQLTPSTATLIAVINDVVCYFATLKQRSATEQIRHRLFLQSLVDDGEFARVGLTAFGDAILPVMNRSVAAARLAGDMDHDVTISRAFWLAALLQIMIGSMSLHGGPNPKDTATTAEWVTEASRFILRGIGVKPAALNMPYTSPLLNLPVDMSPSDINRTSTDHLLPTARVA